MNSDPMAAETQNKIARLGSLLLLCAAVLLSAARIVRAEDPPTLSETIDTGIALLEEKKYEAFLRRYPVPEELAQMLKHRSLEELARSFSKRHADRLLSMLRQIQTKKPHFSSAGALAEYPVTWENFSQNKLVFVKIADRWYLQN